MGDTPKTVTTTRAPALLITPLGAGCSHPLDSTRPSKQCKSLMDATILRQYFGKKFFCRGDEKWIRKISFFCGEE